MRIFFFFVFCIIRVLPKLLPRKLLFSRNFNYLELHVTVFFFGEGGEGRLTCNVLSMFSCTTLTQNVVFCLRNRLVLCFDSCMTQIHIFQQFCIVPFDFVRFFVTLNRFTSVAKILFVEFSIDNKPRKNT